MSTQPFPDIGKHLNKLRTAQEMSIGELSKRSGISKGMISQMEQNKTNPTLLSLWKISSALSIPFQSLVDPGFDKVFEFQNHKNALTMVSDDQKCTLTFLTPVHYIDRLELYRLTLKKDGALTNDSGHPPRTEEIFNVIKGNFLVKTDHSEKILQSGDSIRYSADIAHSIQNHGKSTAEGILVVRFNL